MRVAPFAAAVVFVFVCLPRDGEPSRENTYESFVYWTKNENYKKLKYKQLLHTPDNFSFRDKMSFWLYKRESYDTPSQLVPEDPATLTSSGFNDTVPTKIIIHGWLGNAESFDSVCQILRGEYYVTADYNLVCMDWTEIALDVSYFTARLRCKMIGNYVAELITMLTDYTSQTTDDIHILGFSLGAHIAGYAGKRLNGQVHRITGMDPAKPLFPYKWKNERLSEQDAQFVDIVHTTKLILGQSKPLGNIDFYPNKNYTIQPGCNFVNGEVCSHYKAFQFYARSIHDKNEFKSFKCEKALDYNDEFTYFGEYVGAKYLLFIGAMTVLSTAIKELRNIQFY